MSEIVTLNSKKDKLLSGMVALIILTFGVFHLYGVLPRLIFKFSSKESSATILILEDFEGNYYLGYSFINKFDNREYKFKRRIKNKSEYDGLADRKTIKVEYARYYPEVVFIEELDDKPVFYLHLVALFSIIVALYAYVLVLKDKISLSDFFGGEDV